MRRSVRRRVPVMGVSCGIGVGAADRLAAEAAVVAALCVPTATMSAERRRVLVGLTLQTAPESAPAVIPSMVEAVVATRVF